MDQLNPERHVLVSVHDTELNQQLGQFLKTVFAEHLTSEAADQPFVIGYSGKLLRFKEFESNILKSFEDIVISYFLKAL
jgi:hypothetical protein